MRIIALALSCLLLTGCSVTATDLPLPGGDLPGESYQLKAVFADALNLPDKAHVKVDGVDVGRVSRIEAENYTARVTMVIRKDVSLPTGTTAQLRQATPLGDVFIALHPPKAGAAMTEGDTIGIEHTGAAASVEDTLAALSALVNGGGLAQLKTIVTELNTALDGHSDQARAVIQNLGDTLATLNARTAEIDRILTSAQSLTDTYNRRSGEIDQALQTFPPALKVLSEQTGKLNSTLSTVAGASGDADTLLRTVRPDLTATLRDLGPTLAAFGSLDDTFGPTLQGTTVLGRYFQRTMRGDAAVVNGRFTGVILPPTGSIPDTLKALVGAGR
ncbi:MCE family protein [Pseudonocardiaceae bacterium YIM PH 21723]|nr:MCE family protein [Pseudonocardiaceae bacterium YIM PH 21723]